MKLRLSLPWIARTRRLTVREAWLHHDQYRGQRLSLSGVVRIFDADTPAPYFTLDDGPNRVGLRADAALLRPLVDRAVRASGTLSFKPGVGIFLEVDEIDEGRR